MSDLPQQGDVWDYPYLWARQASAGETEGRKARPAAVAILIRRRDGLNGLVFLAITSQPPAPGRRALQVPDTERQRAGLTDDKLLWVMLDEHNQDIAERSYYLDLDGRRGAFSPRFRKQVQGAFLKALRDRKSIIVKRFDE